MTIEEIQAKGEEIFEGIYSKKVTGPMFDAIIDETKTLSNEDYKRVYEYLKVLIFFYPNGRPKC
jgi:hypothetical protein